MAEPPVCGRCGGRHWFLEPCVGAAPAAEVGPMARASADEVEKALRFYRAHKARERDRQRRKRAAEHQG